MDDYVLVENGIRIPESAGIDECLRHDDLDTEKHCIFGMAFFKEKKK